MSRMTKFLNSIGIEDPEDFDLSFQFIHVSKDENRVEMAICKLTPWDYPHLSRFIEALSNIKYEYSIRFSYEEEPDVVKAISLLEDWGMDHFHSLSFSFRGCLSDAIRTETASISKYLPTLKRAEVSISTPTAPCSRHKFSLKKVCLYTASVETIGNALAPFMDAAAASSHFLSGTEYSIFP